MGGDAFDMVLYLFVLGPAVEWCLKSKRVNGSRPGSRRGIGLAVALLAAVAAVRLSADIWGRPENAFSILGLRVDASTSEIKQAYRKMPNPNPNPNPNLNPNPNPSPSPNPDQVRDLRTLGEEARGKGAFGAMAQAHAYPYP